MTFLTDFVDALADAYRTPADFGRMLSGQLGWSLYKLSRDGNLVDRITEVVQWTISKSRERELYDAAVAGSPTSVTLKNLEPQVPPQPRFAGVDHFEICYPRYKPFINRRELRKAIRRLARNDGPRVLVIDGMPSTGKSHSRFYIQYVAERCNFAVVDIDLRTAYQGLALDADKIATDIAIQMDFGKPTKSDEQPPRRSQIFCNWLTAKLRNSPATWWILIDHCDVPLPSDVIDLLDVLAERTEKSWRNVRLILVSNAVDVPLLVNKRPERERVAAIDQVHVTEFLIEFRQQIGLADDDAEVQRALREIMQRVDPDSPYRAQMIGDAAEEQCRAMMGD